MNKHIPCKRCSGRGFINWTFSEGNTGTATSYVCPDCNGSGVSVVPMTNADRIRAMSDEELATMLKDYKDCSKNCIISNGKHCYQICEEESILLKWLRQPSEEN